MSIQIKQVVVRTPETGQRLDTFLVKETGITRSQIQKLIEKRYILVNNYHVRQHYKVKVNDVITVKIPPKEAEELIPEPLPIEIFYQDNHVVIVNKPAGMVVYPSTGHRHGTLVNALSYYCRTLASVGGPLRPGIVHRLDKDTSGVMVVALNDEAYYNLLEQFTQKTIKRRYIVLVYGNILKEKGEISLKIGRSVSDRKKMSTRVKRGKEAITRWMVLERFVNATLIEATLRTGRTHQIRVHLSSIGHPVLGDRTYGKKTEIEIKGKKRISFPRQMLHAELLGFNHPATEEYLEFTSPLPDDMTGKIKELRLR